MADDRTTHPIGWYRTHIDNDVLKELHTRSDLPAFAQSLGHLGLLALTGGTAFYAAGRWPWPVVVLLNLRYEDRRRLLLVALLTNAATFPAAVMVLAYSTA